MYESKEHGPTDHRKITITSFNSESDCDTAAEMLPLVEVADTHTYAELEKPPPQILER